MSCGVVMVMTVGHLHAPRAGADIGWPFNGGLEYSDLNWHGAAKSRKMCVGNLPAVCTYPVGLPHPADWRFHI